MKKTAFLTLTLFFFLVGCQREEIDRNGDDDYEIIRPVEIFDLIDIRYEFLPDSDNSFTAEPVTIWHRTTLNGTTSPIQSTIVISDTITVWSLFSEIDKHIDRSVRVRTPLIANGEIDTSVLWLSQWTFANGVTESVRQVINGTTITSEIPPQTTHIRELIVTKYNIHITYIATLRSRITGRTVEKTGTWRSVQIGTITIRVHLSDGITRSSEDSELQNFSIQTIY